MGDEIFTFCLPCKGEKGGGKRSPGLGEWMEEILMIAG